jgi:hypothetical protein
MRGMIMKDIFEDMESTIDTFFGAIDKMKEDNNETDN